jgi:hypothetical protein
MAEFYNNRGLACNEKGDYDRAVGGSMVCMSIHLGFPMLTKIISDF